MYTALLYTVPMYYFMYTHTTCINAALSHSLRLTLSHVRTTYVDRRMLSAAARRSLFRDRICEKRARRAAAPSIHPSIHPLILTHVRTSIHPSSQPAWVLRGLSQTSPAASLADLLLVTTSPCRRNGLEWSEAEGGSEGGNAGEKEREKGRTDRRTDGQTD